MPPLSPEMLATQLEKGKPLPVILLVGTDEYLRATCRDRIVAACVDPQASDWGFRRFSAGEDDFVSILAQARTMPMLVPRQVIHVSGLEAIEQAGEASREAAVKELDAYLKDPAPFTILLLEARALDERMRLARLLMDKAQVVAVEMPEDPVERGRLASGLAVRMARERGADIEPDAAEELADLCDANLVAIAQEVDKLATYVGPGRPIRESDVAALVVSEKKYSVWELADMLASRDRRRALTFLDSLLREGEPPPALIGAMAWMYRKLMEARDLGPNVSAWEAAGRLRMRRPAAEMALRHAKRIPRVRLAEGLRALYEADNRLKSGSGDDRAIMEFLVARLIGEEPVPRTGALR